MHFEVLVEELSAKCVLDTLLPKIIGEDHGFSVHSFRGKQDLLSKLPSRLKGYSRWLPPDYRIVILVDRDNDDCRELKQRIVDVVRETGLETRSLVRIAVEELEAWFFGDVPALRTVYPRISLHLERRTGFRDPDAIQGGTWEALDRILKQAGYAEGLASKTEAAKNVSRHMDPGSNRSYSFQVFCRGIHTLLAGRDNVGGR
ncbi:MAG: DUF4276 family protein [Bacillota bacterium]|nr:DUF4276 family protein [Bacillota bacterium]